MHIPTIPHGEHEPHRHFPRPPFQDHPLGLSLDHIERCAIRKFQRAEMGGLNLANTGEDVEQPGEAGIAVGMQGEGLHRRHVPCP